MTEEEREERKLKARIRAKQWRLDNLDRSKETQKKYDTKNRKARSAYKAAWARKNAAKVKEAMRSHYEANREKIIARSAAWVREHRERFEQNQRLHRLENNHKKNEYAAQRRGLTLRATPSWANKFFIEEAYRLATLRTKMLGFQWQVDHIVPLKHAKVCGLHTHDNLQVIPATENYKKGNRHWPDMPR